MNAGTVLAPCGCFLEYDIECPHGYELRRAPAGRQLTDRELCASIVKKIAEQADYLSTEGESGSIRIDSWVEGFTPDEIALLRRLHGRVY